MPRATPKPLQSGTRDVIGTGVQTPARKTPLKKTYKRSAVSPRLERGRRPQKRARKKSGRGKDDSSHPSKPSSRAATSISIISRVRQSSVQFLWKRRKVVDTYEQDHGVGEVGGFISYNVRIWQKWHRGGESNARGGVSGRRWDKLILGFTGQLGWRGKPNVWKNEKGTL